MRIRQIDHSFILLNLRELAHLHSTCFARSEIWHEPWTDYPTLSGVDDSMSYLLDAAARDTYWVAAVDDAGEIRPAGEILACGILERLERKHAEELGIELGDREGGVFYNCVYFHDLEIQHKGLAGAIIEKRIEIAASLGGREIWARTRKDHARMHGILRTFDFDPIFEDEVEEAGVGSVRVLYRRQL